MRVHVLHAALGPQGAALTGLEGRVEAVRTALAASVRLMLEELGGQAAEAVAAARHGCDEQRELAAMAAAASADAEAAAATAATSHADALAGLESLRVELRAELRTAMASNVASSGGRGGGDNGGGPTHEGSEEAE